MFLTSHFFTFLLVLYVLCYALALPLVGWKWLIFPALAAVAANDLLALLAGQQLPHAPCARYVGGTIVERGSVRDLG